MYAKEMKTEAAGRTIEPVAMPMKLAVQIPAACGAPKSCAYIWAYMAADSRDLYAQRRSPEALKR